jgi:hypothetical protein
VAYRAGGFGAASRLVSKGRITARKQVLGESFEHFLLTLEADLSIREGNLPAAARWLDSLTGLAARPSTYYGRDALARASARVALRRDRPSDALGIAQQWTESARVDGRAAAICRAKLVEAIALSRLDEINKSVDAWTEAYAWAAAESAIAPFLEFQEEVVQLLAAFDAAAYVPPAAHEDFMPWFGTN